MKVRITAEKTEAEEVRKLLSDAGFSVSGLYNNRNSDSARIYFDADIEQVKTVISAYTDTTGESSDLWTVTTLK